MFTKLRGYVGFIVLLGLMIPGVLVPRVSAAQPSGLTMKVEPYFGGHFKFGEWLPLHVTLANDGPAIRAEVRADATEAGGQTTYIAPVELPAGARKRLSLYVQPPSFAQSVRVRLMEGERELAGQAVQVTIERNVNYLVGVIAPSTEAFAVLGGLTLNMPSDEGQPQFMPREPQNPRSVRVIPMPLSDISERPEGLRALDALVISGLDTSSLSPEQAEALQGWVEQGGRLILGGGASAWRVLLGLPEALSRSFELSDRAADLQSLEALGEFAGQDVRVPGPFVVTWPEIAHGVLIEQDGRALLVDRRFGEGHLNYAALDLAASPFDAWAGASRFWEKLLTPGSAYPSYAPPDVSPRRMRGNQLSYALQNLPALELPSIRWLAALLAVYILLVGPLNYLLLRRLRKLELGWITIPALTLLFSVGAFVLGFSMRGGDVIVNKISILTFNLRGTAVPVETYVGIFSPARRAYTVNLPGRALVAPFSMESGPWGWEGGGAPGLGTLEIVQGDPAQVRGVQVNQWAMQSFQTESPLPDGWEIESDLTFEGDRVRGRLVNRTGETLLDMVIVNGNRFARLGDLPPGQSQAIDQVLQNTAGAPFPYFLFENMWRDAGPSGPPRELQARQQVLEGYYGNFKGSPESPGQATLIGWMRASPLDVRVSGTRWATQQTSLVVAALNVSYPAGPVHLLPGSLPVRVVDILGDAHICGPDPSQVYVNNGVATLEFQLPEALWDLDVTRMALLAKGGQPPTVEIYDRDGEWAKLDVPSMGEYNLPDPARFILADGGVRLRLSSTTMMGNCLVYELDIEGVN